MVWKWNVFHGDALIDVTKVMLFFNSLLYTKKYKHDLLNLLRHNQFRLIYRLSLECY